MHAKCWSPDLKVSDWRTIVICILQKYGIVLGQDPLAGWGCEHNGPPGSA
jgi:hypothetical protein